MNTVDLKGIRTSLKLTQQEMADKLGVTQATLSRHERDKHLPEHLLRKVADEMGVKIEQYTVFNTQGVSDDVDSVPEVDSREYWKMKADYYEKECRKLRNELLSLHETTNNFYREMLRPKGD